MKGLFLCPPWARSFCPFRACGAHCSPYTLLYIGDAWVILKAVKTDGNNKTRQTKLNNYKR